MSNAIGIAIVAAMALGTAIAFNAWHNPVATLASQNYTDNYLEGLRAAWAWDAACEAWRNRVAALAQPGDRPRACVREDGSITLLRISPASRC